MGELEEALAKAQSTAERHYAKLTIEWTRFGGWHATLANPGVTTSHSEPTGTEPVTVGRTGADLIAVLNIVRTRFEQYHPTSGERHG